jgi:hypothetical protein
VSHDRLLAEIAASSHRFVSAKCGWPASLDMANHPLGSQSWLARLRAPWPGPLQIRGVTRSPFTAKHEATFRIVRLLLTAAVDPDGLTADRPVRNLSHLLRDDFGHPATPGRVRVPHMVACLTNDS